MPVFKEENETIQTKQWKAKIYKNEYGFDILEHETCDYSYLYILIDSQYYQIFDRIISLPNQENYIEKLSNTIFIVMEFRGEERKIAIENYLKHLYKTKERRYSNVMYWNETSVPRNEKVIIRELINTNSSNPLAANLKDGWIYSLFQLSCDFHYI